MNPLVSIIIPVYNSASYLEDCLGSVIMQSYKKLEVIVINDGSTDTSESIIKKYRMNDERIKLYSQENKGLGYTRNRGMKLSDGEFIFFLDSDDYLPKKSIESLVTSIEKNIADYAVGKVNRFNEQRRYIPIRHIEYNLYNENILTNINKTPELIQDSIACNKLWRKEFLVKNQLLFAEGRYYEDLVFTLKASVLAERVEVLKEVVYNWRVRDDEGKPSITQQQMNLENTLDRIIALSSNRKWLSTYFNPSVIEENDLKSLLDILRLHVIKYALVRHEDRSEWTKNILSFIKQIPSDVSNRLPEKEEVLYQLLMDENLSDLYLFSQTFTRTETTQIITQNNSIFTLSGREKDYNVTSFLKPNIIVTKMEKNGRNVRVTGDLVIPKASKVTTGVLYAKKRIKKKQKVEIIRLGPVISSEQVHVESCYKFENQRFTFDITQRLLKGLLTNSVYDFYFKLDEYPEYQTARVRFHPDKEIESISINRYASSYSFYRTVNGNFSLKVAKRNMIRENLRWLFKN